MAKIKQALPKSAARPAARPVRKQTLRDIDRDHRIIRMVIRKQKQTTTRWIHWREALELYGDATGELYGNESFAIDYESCQRYKFGTMIAILDVE